MDGRLDGIGGGDVVELSPCYGDDGKVSGRASARLAPIFPPDAPSNNRKYPRIQIITVAELLEMQGD